MIDHSGDKHPSHQPSENPSLELKLKFATSEIVPKSTGSSSIFVDNAGAFLSCSGGIRSAEGETGAFRRLRFFFLLLLPPVSFKTRESSNRRIGGSKKFPLRTPEEQHVGATKELTIEAAVSPMRTTTRKDRPRIRDFSMMRSI